VTGRARARGRVPSDSLDGRPFRRTAVLAVMVMLNGTEVVYWIRFPLLVEMP
jgi:hypothetical protein